MKTILIVTDTWKPLANNLTYALEQIIANIKREGYDVTVWSPETFGGCSKPIGIELLSPVNSLKFRNKILPALRSVDPISVHLLTPGALGRAVGKACRKLGWPFTATFSVDLANETSLTRFMARAYENKFYRSAQQVMIPFASLEAPLKTRRIKTHFCPWGVDSQLFPCARLKVLTTVSTTILYVGRVNGRDGLEDFLDLNIEGLKIVVGGGPALASYKEQNPGVVFVGPVEKSKLSHYYAESSVVVFPARSCPFNLEVLEALASGIPIAGRFVPGIKDYVSHTDGFISDDLELAVKIAQKIKGKHIGEAQAAKYTWGNTARCFLGGLVPILTERPPSD